MPQYILSNFPEKLSRDEQVHSENLQALLLSQAKSLETSTGKEYVVHVILNENLIQNTNVNILMEIPARRGTKRIFNKSISLNKFLEKIQENGLGDLKISEVRFELADSFSRKQIKSQEQRADSSILAKPTSPVWNFSQIISREETLREIKRAVAIFEKKTLLFETWGLKAVKPQNSVLINLSGPPGTGKTMVAHAIANKIGLPIIELSYAQIESKYVGDGPKNIRRAFENAAKENALIFFDEADSLLGQRIRNVTDGADQAINSMRSQMIIELDRFHGIALFATNLIVNYDHSFRSRLNTISVPLPDKSSRAEILKLFLNSCKIPGTDDITPSDINNFSQEAEGLSGRDLRDAFILAATEMVLDESTGLKDSLRKTLSETIKSRLYKGEE